MRWLDDPSGRFPARPYFETAELDLLGSRLAGEAGRRRRRRRFEPPLDTDSLLVLLEAHVDDLDLFADLEPLGAGVEGFTEFHPGRRPVVRVERRLTADPRRHLRFRFTLAHELGHVVLHRELWERRFAQRRLFPRGAPAPETAHSRSSAGGRGGAARGGDWLEWQAAYLAAALLVPAPALAARAGALTRVPGLKGPDPRPFAGTPEGDALVDAVARSFQVSAEAAAVRLEQTRWLREPAEARQRSFWTP